MRTTKTPILAPPAVRPSFTAPQLALVARLSRTVPTVLDGRTSRAAYNLSGESMSSPLTKETKAGWVLTATGEKLRAKMAGAAPQAPASASAVA